jgi:hypothetical protein
MKTSFLEFLFVLLLPVLFASPSFAVVCGVLGDVTGNGIGPLAITTPRLLHGNVGGTYCFFLTAYGTDLPLSWSASGLPRGLSLTGNLISGKPLRAGKFPVTIMLQDASGVTVQSDYSLQICTFRRKSGTTERSCDGFGN